MCPVWLCGRLALTDDNCEGYANDDHDDNLESGLELITHGKIYTQSKRHQSPNITPIMIAILFLKKTHYSCHVLELHLVCCYNVGDCNSVMTTAAAVSARQ